MRLTFALGVVALCLLAALGRDAVAVEPARQTGVERGVLPMRWTAESPDCAAAPAFLVHGYNPTFYILLSPVALNFEKPFLYLLLGTKEALLVDTGAAGARVSPVVEELLRRHSQRQRTAVLSLLVVHSHGHSDHTAGDADLSQAPGARVSRPAPRRSRNSSRSPTGRARSPNSTLATASWTSCRSRATSPPRTQSTTGCHERS